MQPANQILLTSISGDSLGVANEAIRSVSADGAGARVELTSGESIRVRESVAEVYRQRHAIAGDVPGLIERAKP